MTKTNPHQLRQSNLLRLKLKSHIRNIYRYLLQFWLLLRDASTASGRMRRRLIRQTSEINDKRIDKFATYEQQRVEARGVQTAPPIYQDKNGKVHWLNRSARRKLK